MYTHSKYNTFLFDFDYTLADSSAGIVFCFQTVFKQYGYNDIADDDIKRTIGKTLEESFMLLSGLTDMDLVMKMKQDYIKTADVHMNGKTILYHDTIYTLRKLKQGGAKVGIISTKYRYRITTFMSSFLPEDFFDIVIGGEDVSTPKPSPEGLLYAVDKLDVDKSDVLYIGDSTVDAETATRAGISFAGVLNGTTTKEELMKYDNVFVANSLSELCR